jgi:tetratricopeptide (TPR) repeat protein
MFSVIIAAAIAIGAFVAGVSLFDVWSGLGLGFLLGVAALVLLLRRGRKQVEGAIKEVESHVKGQRFEKAIAALESLRPLARWQLRLGPSIDGQIGMLRYAHMRDFEGARPYLEKSHPKLWQAWAMLAGAHFKKDRIEEMRKVFERAVKANKEAGLLWSAYAFCEWKKGHGTQAIQVLARAHAALPKDERIKTQLQALQNGKKLKMSSSDPEWLALHLDKPLPNIPPGGMRPRFLPPARKVGARYRM